MKRVMNKVMNKISATRLSQAEISCTSHNVPNNHTNNIASSSTSSINLTPNNFKPNNPKPKYWILKTEPNCYSWSDMKKDRITKWDGVRNFTARNYMKTMQIGDIGYFYHTGSERKIVGAVKICSTYYPDPRDERFVIVDVGYLGEVKNQVSLSDMRVFTGLQDMVLFKQGRLSVVPLTNNEASIINEMIQIM